MNKITNEDIRAAGGIVHKDGNIFFTNLALLHAAIEQKQAAQVTHLTHERDIARKAVKDTDLKARNDVARALDLPTASTYSFAWEYLLSAIEECVKVADELATLRAAPAPVKVPGLGRITNEDDGFYTLQFVDEEAGQVFMQQYEPSVDVRDMPDVTPYWEQSAPVSAVPTGDDECAKFEEAMNELGYTARMLDCDANGNYRMEQMQEAWTLWQVARASLPSASPPVSAAEQAKDVCAEMRALCSACGGTGDVTSIDGEWRGSCDCEASKEPADGQELPPLDDFAELNRATDHCYPMPDSPHASVMQRTIDNRSAFRLGWNARAALAMRQPQGDTLTEAEILDACWHINKEDYSDENYDIAMARAVLRAVAAKQAGKEAS